MKFQYYDTIAYQACVGNPYVNKRGEYAFFFKKNIYIKIDKATEDTEQLRVNVHSNLNNMMHAKTIKEFDLSPNLFPLKYKEYTTFIEYFTKIWVPKKENRSQAWSQASVI